MRSLAIALLTVLVFVLSAAAQHGGKAEPNRIEFVPGRSSKTVTGTLANHQEMEYVFAAVKGQKVTIRNATRSLFDFRVFSDEFNVETEFESSPTLTLELPATGDYYFFVRKKMIARPSRARFSLTLTIK
ncbi:MAG: hypothetical protein JO053_12190 [Acidobacteria bacterium]|nr:hypothetical protein [Acidobacteriota bacterium]